jgi:hypothetical protein
VILLWCPLLQRCVQQLQKHVHKQLMQYVEANYWWWWGWRLAPCGLGCVVGVQFYVDLLGVVLSTLQSSCKAHQETRVRREAGGGGGVVPGPCGLGVHVHVNTGGQVDQRLWRLLRLSQCSIAGRRCRSSLGSFVLGTHAGLWRCISRKTLSSQAGMWR